MIMYFKRPLVLLLSFLTSITTCIAMQDSVSTYDISQNHSSYYQAQSSSSLASTQDFATAIANLSIKDNQFTSIQVIHQPEAPAQLQYTTGIAYNDGGMILQTTNQATVPLVAAIAMTQQGQATLAKAYNNSTATTTQSSATEPLQNQVPCTNQVLTTGEAQAHCAPCVMAPVAQHITTGPITFQANPLTLACYMLNLLHQAIKEHPVAPKMPGWIAPNSQLAQLYPSFEKAQETIVCIKEHYNISKGHVSMATAQQWANELTAFKTVLQRYESILASSYGTGSCCSRNHLQEVQELQQVATQLDLNVQNILSNELKERKLHVETIQKQCATMTTSQLHGYAQSKAHECQEYRANVARRSREHAQHAKILAAAQEHCHKYASSIWMQANEFFNTGKSHADYVQELTVLPGMIHDDIFELRTAQSRLETAQLELAVVQSEVAKRLSVEALPYLRAEKIGAVDLNDPAIQQSKAAYDALKTAAMPAEGYHAEFANMRLENLKALPRSFEHSSANNNKLVVGNPAATACLHLTIAEEQVAFEQMVKTESLELICNGALELDNELAHDNWRSPSDCPGQADVRQQALNEMHEALKNEIAKRLALDPAHIDLKYKDITNSATDLLLASALLQNAAVQQEALGNHGLANELWSYAQYGAECVKVLGNTFRQGLTQATEPFGVRLKALYDTVRHQNLRYLEPFLPKPPILETSVTHQCTGSKYQLTPAASPELEGHVRTLCGKIGYKAGKLVPTILQLAVSHQAANGPTSGGSFTIQPGGIIAAVEKATLPCTVPVIISVDAIAAVGDALAKSGNPLSESNTPQQQGDSSKAGTDIPPSAAEQEKPANADKPAQADEQTASAANTSKPAENYCNVNGKAFEDFLQKTLGGTGSFTVKSAYGTREFDGSYGNVWYEAKFGKALSNIVSSKEELERFQRTMGKGLKIANLNGVKYELHSSEVIPQVIKDWCIDKGIGCVEWPSFKL